MLKRLAFRIGDGTTSDTSMVADDVQVRHSNKLTGASAHFGFPNPQRRFHDQDPARHGPAGPPPVSAQAQSASYSIDPTHTFVTLRGQALRHLDAARPLRPQGRHGAVRPRGQERQGPDRDRHGLGEHWRGPARRPPEEQGLLRRRRCPEAGTFVADKFVFDGDKVTEVDGRADPAGQEQPGHAKASNFNCYQSPMLKREVCGGDFETTTRSQWGMAYGPRASPTTSAC